MKPYVKPASRFISLCMDENIAVSGDDGEWTTTEDGTVVKKIETRDGKLLSDSSNVLPQ
jgi:hypothetical protein